MTGSLCRCKPKKHDADDAVKFMENIGWVSEEHKQALLLPPQHAKGPGPGQPGMPYGDHMGGIMGLPSHAMFRPPGMGMGGDEDFPQELLQEGLLEEAYARGERREPPTGHGIIPREKARERTASCV
jgi:hypothetical protein